MGCLSPIPDRSTTTPSKLPQNIAVVTGEKQNIIEIAGAETGHDDSELLATAKDLRKRAQALLEAGIDPEDAAEICNHLEKSAEAVRHGNLQALAEHNHALSDLVFYLED